MHKRLSRAMPGLSAAALACTAIAQQASTVEPVVAPVQTQVSTPTATPLGIAQVVDHAITSHPEMNARYHDFVSSLEDQNVARAGWRPNLSANAWVGKEWRSNLDNAPSYNWNRPGWSLELRQLIFDGGATSGRISQYGFEKLSRYYDLQATGNTLASEAVAAYLDVQRYREMQSLAQENFAMHENTLYQLRDRQESGVGRGVDLEQASGRLSLAQTNLMTESNNLNDVTQRYRRVVGAYPAAEMPVVPEITGSLPVIGVTQDFSQPLRASPYVLSKQALVQAAQAGVQVAKAAHAPVLDVRAATGRDREQPGAQYRDVQSSRVQLMLSYPLYRGGGDAARIRQTTAQTYAAQDVRDYTCRNIQQELSIAWNNIVRLRQQMPFLREHELSTSKVRVAYLQQYRIGQRSLLDLLDTENELFDARRAYINAQYDLKKVEYQWLAWANQILPTLSLVQPHQHHLPDEQQALVLPDEPLRACMEGLPDTSNLTPIALKPAAPADVPAKSKAP